MRSLAITLTLVACGNSAATPAAAPVASTEPAPVASTPAPSSEPAPVASAAPAVPSKPEFEATPTADLKKNTKADLTAAAKLVKDGDAWDGALATLTKKIGPQTYIANATDPSAPFSATYYWSAMIKGGGCDKLFVQMSADKKTVLGRGTKAVGKDESTYPDKGGAPIDPCTGLPKK